MKLKELKGQPLLSPPRLERGWWMMTDEDLKLMERALKGTRTGWFVNESERASNLLTIHYSMSRLGVPQKVTPEDEERIRKDYLRADDIWLLDLSSKNQMRGIGLDVEITGEDRRRAREKLEKLRGDEYRDTDAGAENLIGVLAIMSGMGIHVEPTKQDVESIQSYLVRHRKGRQMPQNTSSHYRDLRRAGIPIGPTEKELDDMKRLLEMFRKDKGGYGVAWLLEYLQVIMQQGETDQPPVPPLKRFKG